MNEVYDIANLTKDQKNQMEMKKGKHEKMSNGNGSLANNQVACAL